MTMAITLQDGRPGTPSTILRVIGYPLSPWGQVASCTPRAPHDDNDDDMYETSLTYLVEVG